MVARGDKRSIERLKPLSYPDELEYLYQWVLELHGRSGVGMGGLNPLGYTTIADWSRLKGIDVAPHEVEALIYLDAVLLHPGKSEGE